MNSGSGDDEAPARPGTPRRPAGDLPGHVRRPEHVRRADPAAVAAANQTGRQQRGGPSPSEIAEARRQQRRRRRRVWLVGTAVVLLAAVVIGITLTRGPLARQLPGGPDPQETNPFGGRDLYVASGTQASAAADAARSAGEARDAEVLDRLADVPTATWLTPEALPRGQVGAFVRDIAEAALEADDTALLVVYGITDRDCSGDLSAGGLPPADYAAWVGEIASAAGIGDGHAAVVLEPDGLASTFDCGNTDQRVGQLAGAIGSLVDADVPTYVDAGHSNWRSVDEMADLLRRVDVSRVRGFSTNVAAYQSDADERTYAEALSSALGGAHYVIDSGRNGAPSPASGDWCNPSARLLGQDPAVVGDGSHQDARLWIKPPGESDGTCNGGPDAGTFWVERALEMAFASGW
ncbi:glycoside hydrolase family 6 protein [Nocardioides zeae]|uniref:Glucanase n=1 Tax=Nocardioides zeae TaxID=1457234 RepID=A0A6P0HFD2_9ACTN|nr:glycoside hydrolase family 6 protein [Nocardioides zeae]NEN77044.1 glycoside hydrolase family 6 protein [Nocardioides zeae]